MFIRIWLQGWDNIISILCATCSVQDDTVLKGVRWKAIFTLRYLCLNANFPISCMIHLCWIVQCAQMIFNLFTNTILSSMLYTQSYSCKDSYQHQWSFLLRSAAVLPLYVHWLLLQDGSNPLSMASEKGHTSVVKLLLAAKAEVDVQTKVLHQNCCFGLLLMYISFSHHLGDVHSYNGTIIFLQQFYMALK